MLIGLVLMTCRFFLNTPRVFDGAPGLYAERTGEELVHDKIFCVLVYALLFVRAAFDAAWCGQPVNGQQDWADDGVNAFKKISDDETHVLFPLIFVSMYVMSSGDTDTHHLHDFKLHPCHGLGRRIIGQVDSLSLQVFIFSVAFVFKGDLATFDHQGIEDPVPLFPLHMRSHLCHVRMDQLWVLFHEFFWIGMHSESAWKPSLEFHEQYTRKLMGTVTR